MKSVQHCYMCDNFATSQEHVPPRSFFPKGKELHGDRYLSNLITVPSCELHNLKKSNGDEFALLMFMLVKGSNRNRAFAYPRIHRAARRNMRAIFEFASRISVDNQDRTHTRLPAARIDDYLDTMGRALYYHNFRKQYAGPFYITANFLKRVGDGLDEQAQIVLDHMQSIYIEIAYCGENQEYFAMRTFNDPTTGKSVIEGLFYQEFRVFWIY